MNKAEDYAEWRAAMEMLALPSLNAVYADGDGVIAYYYNAAIPVRAAGPDYADYVRNAKVAVLRCIEPIRLEDVVLGQYVGSTSLDGATETSGDLKSMVLHNMEMKHTKSTFPCSLGARISCAVGERSTSLHRRRRRDQAEPHRSAAFARDNLAEDARVHRPTRGARAE